MGIVKQKIVLKEPLVVLSGDIGGTNSRLQLTRFFDDDFITLVTKEYKNAEFNDFTDIVKLFLQQQNIKVQRACFAVAGPIIKNSVKLTNLPWQLSTTALANTLNIPQVYFINDYEAIGYGILLLKPKDYYQLQQGAMPTRNIKAILGAGTGLGVALLQAINGMHHVIATEGGHVDFAPTNAIQQALLSHLYKKLHRVSAERIVSGLGITNIYKFLRTQPEYIELESSELKHLSLFSNNFAKDITEFALQRRDPIALQTLDIFVRSYGSVAGNLALTTLPDAGLYIAGGIAPKLLSVMKDGRFMEAFLDKGRMSGLLADIPVYIILNTLVGLIGAAYYAVYSITSSE